MKKIQSPGRMGKLWSDETGVTVEKWVVPTLSVNPLHLITP